MKRRDKRGVKKYTVLLLGLAFLLTACGDAPSGQSGLVSPEALKNYEHGVRMETEPTSVPNQGDTQQGTPTPTPDPAAPSGPTPATAEDGDYEETNDTVYVAVSKLNLRAGPSTDSEIVGKAVYGDSFTRVAKGKNGWDKLLFGEQVVYAFAEYLSTEDVAGIGTGSELGILMADAKKN